MDVRAALLVLVLGVLVTSPIWIIGLIRLLRRSAMRALEARQFKLAETRSIPESSRQTRGAIRFLFATTLPPAYALAVFAAAGISSDPSVPVPISLLAGLILPAALVVIALCFHYSGSRRRRLKYDLIFAAMVQVFALGNVLVLVGWWLFFIASQVVVFHLAPRIVRSGRTSIVFYWIQSRWVIVTGFILAPVLFVYGLLRFYLVDTLGQRPILYFRSFHHPAGREAFGAIVAKAARRFGIIEGLVHRAQTGSDLHSNLDVTDQAHFSYVSDAAWQSWVRDKLRSASIVIIDVTGATESLTWEIAESVKTVGVARIAALADRGNYPQLPANVWRLSYTLDKRGARSARRELASWLRRQLLPHRAGDSRVPQPVSESPR
jgi:hypothetical protein